ncbi:tRNA A64-2'-O-ribosylphosphate transferase [Thermothelomyces heterothallicus CBS 202.75]|uniref:tRNA A64-2'-O-ribosylphosphate transferase n=1 Tax=Thermothelomyces heterothallicus CBS 202.75 TaxID=1149848 RepID=UPI003742A00A
MPAPTLDQVIFPEPVHHNLSRILGDLKRSNLSITNRLRSISQDAAFVEQVADALRLPLIANERCGSWYTDPARKAGSAYFKSTDGHTGQWKFSLRRLNLHLLPLIGENNGIIIVDSTRRGKRMPDALSKTVPTWCAVLNRALFPSLADSHELYTPPNAVSASEASQIAALLPGFVSSFLSLQVDLAPLRARLGGRPLRPFWVTQEDDLSVLADGPLGAAHRRRDGDGDLAGFHPVVCCTASRRVVGTGTEAGEAGGYIQGAGDDTENWALGLTAGIFWRWKEDLLAAGEGELPDLIGELVAREDRERRGGGGGVLKEVVKGKGLFVGLLGAEVGEEACVVRLVPKVTEREGWVKGKRCLEVGIGKSRAASRLLRDALAQVCEFVLAYLREPDLVGKDAPQKKAVVVLCETGKDLSVGVALAIYCWCFDDAGNVREDDGTEVSFNKAGIRVRLGHIVTAFPEANPNRATLQSVNSFLMDWRK